MPRTKVTAKKDFAPLFKVGDKLTIVPNLYEEDTLLHRDVYGVFKGEELVRIGGILTDKEVKSGCVVNLMWPALYAPKGSFESCSIELADGTKYPGTLIRDFSQYFVKELETKND